MPHAVECTFTILGKFHNFLSHRRHRQIYWHRPFYKLNFCIDTKTDRIADFNNSATATISNINFHRLSSYVLASSHPRNCSISTPFPLCITTTCISYIFRLPIAILDLYTSECDSRAPWSFPYYLSFILEVFYTWCIGPAPAFFQLFLQTVPTLSRFSCTVRVPVFLLHGGDGWVGVFKNSTGWILRSKLLLNVLQNTMRFPFSLESLKATGSSCLFCPIAVVELVL